MGKLNTKAKCKFTYRDYPHDIISFSPKINTETIEVKSGSTDTSNKSYNISKGSTSIASNSSIDSNSEDKVISERTY